MPNNHKLKTSRRLRLNMTDAEARLWYLLRDRRLVSAKFRRQFPIGAYIADFYCHEHALIIEADGGQHADNARDVQRTEWLQSQGLRVLRFWNDDILKNQDVVMTAILHTLRAPSPAAEAAASPRGRGDYGTEPQP